MAKEWVKEESRTKNERYFIFGGRKSVILLEGSQASPACLSGTNTVKVKTLECLDVLGKGPRNFDFLN
jgi:hypothetical protein